jgi:hypothetical protein
MPSVITEPEDIADSASAGRSGGHVASADVPRSTKGAAMKTAANAPVNTVTILTASDPARTKPARPGTWLRTSGPQRSPVRPRRRTWWTRSARRP